MVLRFENVAPIGALIPAANVLALPFLALLVMCAHAVPAMDLVEAGETGRMVAVRDGNYAHAPLPERALGARIAGVAVAGVAIFGIILERLFISRVYDAVINLAARAGVRQSVENPWVYIETNETGTLPNPGPGSPMLMVAESLAPGDMSDLAAFSRERVMAGLSLAA